MKSSHLLAGLLAALGTTGCLASKGDIRLLQDQLRDTRVAAARSDSVHERQIDSLVAALTALSSMQSRGDQALRQMLQQTDSRITDLANREKGFEITTNEHFKSTNEDVAQVQELARQNVRGVTAARAAAEQAAVVTSPPVAPADSTAGAAPPPTTSIAPGPATLLQAGNAAILQGSCRVARRNYEDLIQTWPNDPLAAEAQLRIAESFIACADGGNPAAADSVYSVVISRYPKTDQAATALWKKADALQKLGKNQEAKALLQRIVCDFPKSVQVYPLAVDRIGTPKSCK
jgi:TolA-binding protein